MTEVFHVCVAQKKLSNPAISGNILLVERGKVTFQQKALRAQAAGACACRERPACAGGIPRRRCGVGRVS